MTVFSPRSRQFFSGIRSLITATLPLLLGVSPAVAEHGEKAQSRALQEQAKTLIREAKTLEKQGQLGEARLRFVQSQGFRDSNDAQSGVKRVDQAVRKRTEAVLKTAHRLYKEGKYREAASALESTSTFRAPSADVAFDLALCYRQLGDLPTAVEHLERAAAASSDSKRRQQLLEWRTTLATGDSPPGEFAPGSREQLQAVNRMVHDLDSGGKRMFGSLNRPPVQEAEDNTTEDSTSTDSEGFENFGQLTAGVCQSLARIGASAAKIPAVLFNLANCAENTNAPGRAADLLEKYLQVAPNATDASRVHARIRDLREIAGLPDGQGSQVRALYASAFEQIYARRYDAALVTLQRAAKVAPSFAPTLWRLALLYEGRGDIEAARRHFTTYLQLETSPDAAQAAKQHLETLGAKRQLYQEELHAAVQILSNLLNRAMNLTFNGLEDRSAMFRQADRAKKQAYSKNAKFVAGFGLPLAYAQQQLREALEHLTRATSVFPSAPEANQLLGLLMLQANDSKKATGAFDTVAGNGLPVGFYAQMRGQKQDRAVKCELSRDGIELLYLASYGKGSKPVAPATKAGNDGLADLVSLTLDREARRAESMKISAHEIKGVETKNGHLILKLTKEQIVLAPLCLGFVVPVEGPPSRRFANSYTRLFVRYSGLEQSKLGAEGLTGFEKVKLGYRLANNGLGIAFSLNPLGAITAAQNAYAITRTLQRVAKSLNVSYAAWENTLQDQLAAQLGEPFKVIPTQRPNWTFVE